MKGSSVKTTEETRNEY